jgi:hypothetical protein
MAKGNNDSFSLEVESEEEWEQKWQEFIQLARQYGWPEDYLQAFLQDHKVSYQERLKSLERAHELWEEGQYGEAIFEDKRTMLRTPVSPAEVRTLRSHLGNDQ